MASWIIVLIFAVERLVECIDYVNPPLIMTATPDQERLNENELVTFQCQLDADPMPLFSIRTDEMNLGSVNQGMNSIQLALGRELNRADIYCHANGSLPEYPLKSNTVSFVVQFSASHITLEQSPSGQIPDNTDVMFICRTNEAEPTASVRFDIAGESIFGSAEEENGLYNAEKRISRISKRIDKTMNGKLTECFDTETPATKDVLTLNVSFVATSVDMSVSPSGPVSEGTSVIITCNTDEANPTSVMKWSRDGSPIPASSEDVNSGSYNALTTVSRVTVTAGRSLNKAVYRCSVDGTDLSVQHELNVIFLHDVEITRSQSNPLPTGAALTLTCVASGGNPPPVDSYNWIFQPRYSDSSELDDPTVSVVQFDSIDYKRAGEYTCEAKNGAGVNTKSETVLVEFYPQDISSLGQKLVYTRVNTVVNLNCTVRAYPELLPDNVSISFKDRLIKSGDIKLTALPRDATLIQLIFNPVTEEDYGEYEVTTNNGFGSRMSIQMTLSKFPIEWGIKSKTSTSLTIFWLPPTSKYDAFKIQISSEDHTEFLTVSETIHRDSPLEKTYNNLKPGRSYRVVVDIITDGGRVSNDLVALTKPSRVEQLTAVAVDKTTIKLTWQVHEGSQQYLFIINVTDSFGSNKQKEVAYSNDRVSYEEVITNLNEGYFYTITVVARREDVQIADSTPVKVIQNTVNPNICSKSELCENPVQASQDGKEIAVCIPAGSSYFCQCPNGYRWEKSLNVCLDIDESLVGNCGCEEVCTNQFVDRDGRRYQCGCKDPGKQLSPDGRTCIDKAEDAPSLIIYPLFGPKSGGTVIDIRDKDLSGDVTVHLGSKPLMIDRKSLTHIQVVTPTMTGNSLVNKSQNLELMINGKNTVSVVFTYMDDPVIDIVQPLAAIAAGGTILTVSGENMNAVASPLLYVVKEDTSVHMTYTSHCQVISNSVMECPMPVIDALTIHNEVRRRRQTEEERELSSVYIGFEFDGVDTYEDLRDTKPEYSEVTVFINPEIASFPGDGILEYNPGTGSKIDIRGEHIDQGARATDYSILVETEECTEVEIFSTSISCLPPSEPPEMSQQLTNTKDGFHQVVVRVGFYTFSMGHLKYIDEPTENTMLAIYVGAACALVAVVAFCAIIVFCCCMKRKGNSGKDGPA